MPTTVLGQNKNNATIQYLAWRVLNKKEEFIELSFMLVGHTKFSPDRHFGVFKKSFRKSSVSTLAEIAVVAERSASITPQLVGGLHRDTKVPFYQWSKYLSQFFRTIPNVTSYQNFKFSSSNPGTVTCSEFSDSLPNNVNILNARSTQLSSMPEKTVIPGLDAKRQWYLYEHIRSTVNLT